MTAKEPLHVQLYTELANRILDGVWQEGESLPSENALIAEFGMSRGPVRQALARLRSEGLIHGGQGKSPQVQRVTPAQPFETYVSFTEWAEELGREPGQRTVAVGEVPASGHIASELGIEQGAPVVAVTRVRTLDGNPAMLERSSYVFEAGKHLLTADLDAHSIYRVLREHDHVPTRARNVIDAVLADAEDAEWLRVPVGAALLRVRRRTYDQHNEVLDFAENRYVPQQANLVIENSRQPHTSAVKPHLPE